VVADRAVPAAPREDLARPLGGVRVLHGQRVEPLQELGGRQPAGDRGIDELGDPAQLAPPPSSASARMSTTTSPVARLHRSTDRPGACTRAAAVPPPSPTRLRVEGSSRCERRPLERMSTSISLSADMHPPPFAVAPPAPSSERYSMLWTFPRSEHSPARPAREKG